MQQIKGKHFKSSHPIRGKAPKFGSTLSEDAGDPYQVTFTRGPSNPCLGTDSEDHLIRHTATLVPGQALQFHSQAAKPLTTPPPSEA